jgi:AcrR family transcriptional regulator
MFSDHTNAEKLTPQARRQAQTRHVILEHARAAIAQRGMAGLSIRGLADSIDYTPGALYEYFKNKEDLVDAVRADCFESLNTFILQRIQSAQDAAGMLLLGGLAYIEYAALHPQEYHLMFNMEPSQATSGEQRQIAMRSLLDIVRFGMEQGQFEERPGYDADTIAYHCWATVHGIASLQTTVLLAERPGVEDVIRNILTKVIDGFTVGSNQGVTS